MICDLIRDLLPSYLEGLTSESSNEEIRFHLENCGECREYYEQMRAPLEEEKGRKRRRSTFCVKSDEGDCGPS